MNLTDYLIEYSQDIISGKERACRSEIQACKRFISDLSRQNTDDFPFRFDETRAQRIVDWFGYCRHVRGIYAGEPIVLQTWQQFDLCNLFGWVHPITGKRRFKTGYIRIARGNTKSTMMSGVCLFGLCADVIYPYNKPKEAKFERQPEVACVAVDREQAAIVWGNAREMAIASPAIFKRLNVQKTAISHKDRGGSLKKLSRDTKNKDGGSPTIIVVDEYHAHPTSAIKDITSSGKGKRAQCLELIITTAGEDAENKPCKIEDEIVKKILFGEIVDETYYGMIREIDDDDDPHDERNWVKANPLFRSNDEYAKELYSTVKSEHALAFGSMDNSKIRQWMIKRANRWQMDSEQKYFSGHMEQWKKLAIPRPELFKLIYGRRGYVGIDLSKCIDLTATGYVFLLDDGRFAITAQGFLPTNAVEKHEKTDRVPYRSWSADGWITLTPGDVTDDNAVKRNILSNEVDFNIDIAEICYDPYACRTIAADLTESGYQCVEVRQGVVTLSEPTKKFRELVMQGLIVHDGSPALTWCLSNALEIADSNGNIKLSKKHKDDSQRIDLIAAIINAMTRALVPESESIYNHRGLLSLGD